MDLMAVAVRPWQVETECIAPGSTGYLCIFACSHIEAGTQGSACHIRTCAACGMLGGFLEVFFVEQLLHQAAAVRS